MRVTRGLAFPVLRTLPWRAVAAGGGLGLVIAGVQRFAGGEPDARAALLLLRSAILAYALGLAFLLDDPARHTTATVPVRRHRASKRRKPGRRGAGPRSARPASASGRGIPARMEATR